MGRSEEARAQGWQPLFEFEPVPNPDGRSLLRTHVSQYGTAESRATVLASLERVARIASGGEIAAEVFPWHQLRWEHIVAIREVLGELYSAGTANHTLSMLRMILEAAWSANLISRDQFKRLAKIRRFPESGALRGRALRRDEVERLFAACSESERPRFARDGALFALLYGAGLRRREAVELDFRCFDAETGALDVLGKGGRQRWAYLPSGPLAAVSRWLEHRGTEPGPLIATVTVGSNVRLARMSPRAVYDACERWARLAGLDPFTPHDLRRTYITELLDAGVDVLTVRALAGHRMVETTSRYDLRTERSKAQAAARLPFPTIEEETS